MFDNDADKEQCNMTESLWITTIAVVGGVVAVLGWKLLDIGRRAMELDRHRHDRPCREARP